MTYLTLKSLHIISVVAWFAGLFYIFRLFVYHRENAQNEELCRIFSIMERRLLRAIILPASIASATFGIAMITQNPMLLQAHWLWLKLLGVLGLFAYQAYAFRTWRQFSAGRFTLSSRACRMINEWPTLILILGVFMAILKPQF